MGNTMRVFIVIMVTTLVLSIIEQRMSAYRGRVVTLKSDARFHRIIREKNQFAIVLFYEESRHDDRDWKEEIRTLKDTFKQAHCSEFYRQAGLIFAHMNLACAATADVACRYHIQEVPAMILFKRGHPVIDTETNQPVQLKGFVSTQDIDAFIHRHLAKDMKAFVDEKIKEEQARARERALYGSRCALYPAYGYYPYYGIPSWPYYYYGYGWPYYYHSHPRVDIGFGFHL